MIYLDHAAATPINETVFSAYKNALFTYFANPSSSHALGRELTRNFAIVDNKILKLLKLGSEFEIIHVSGATEANNLAILGYCLRNSKKGREVWCLPSEHPSTLSAMEDLDAVHHIKLNLGFLNSDGSVDLIKFKEQINVNTLLVSISLVNSEVGFINDIKEIVNLVRAQSNAKIHVDLVQGFGHVELFDLNSVDFLTLSLHKLGGPKCHGILIKRKNLMLQPLSFGGGQQNNLRSGTQDLPGAIAMYKALTIAEEKLLENHENIQIISDYLFKELSNNPDVIVNSLKKDSPYIFNFSLKQHKASVIIEALSNRQIYVSSTSACSSRTNSVSKTLVLLGRPIEQAENCIRLSFSFETTLDEIKEFNREFMDILKETKKNG